MATDEPLLVSVILPTFNRLPLLRHALASVQAQTFAAWEAVVADDGSTDGTAEWVRHEAERDPRVRLLALERDGNISRVRNRAIAAARGEYLAFLDSDDLWLPAKLELSLAALQAPPREARWSCTHFEGITATGEPLEAEFLRYRWPRPGWVLEAMLRYETAISTDTVVMERAFLLELGGFDESIERAADYHLWLRAAAKSPCVVPVPVLTRKRAHPGQFSNTNGGVTRPQVMLAALERFLATQQSPRILRLGRGLKARFAFENALLQYKRRRPLAVLRALARSVWWDPSASVPRQWFRRKGIPRLREKLRGARLR
jgi:glycosyltransferase involved in cell wall biosynthesis